MAEERADRFFSGVVTRDPIPPPPEKSWEALAAGPAVATLRGISLAGAAVRLSGEHAYRLAAVPGSIGLDVDLDLFGGRSASGERGGFSMTIGAMLFRSWAAWWLSAGLDVGYATLTRIGAGTRIDGVAFGPHLAAGVDLLTTRWGALFLRADVLGATPEYYRGGVSLGMRFGPSLMGWAHSP